MEQIAAAMQVLFMCLQAHIEIQERKKLLLSTILLRRQRTNRPQSRLHARRQLVLRLVARRRSHVIWEHPRSRHWWDTIVPDFNAQQFMQNFRVSRDSFMYICDRTKTILARQDTNYRLSVPVEKRVAIAIWKLATGSEYRTISHLFGVGLSTVFNCVQEFCKAVNTVLLPEHIKIPDGPKLIELATFFSNRWRVPQCVGAIDGSHIPIIAPEEYPKDYFNRKGWHSVVLQAVVDGRGLFWDVCVGFPGSVHDARVFRQSHLWDVLSGGQLLGLNKVNISGCDVGHYLLGDPAYPMQRWLMKPFSDTGRLTPDQQNFNYRVSSARSVVEMAFGRLKGRWRCLLKRNDCKLELCKTMALTCCVFHNICEEHGDNFMEELPGRHFNVQPAVQALPDNGNPEGSDVRAALMEYFSQN
ncbi:uncharacterized protein LOC133978761 [Scomber scombrus]|nr:uncharacterized protein LOC133978761 [Scomber scombrus]